ncbi:MAG: hypothetical protein RLZZ444_1395 [Pseudomonadota bacterium]|jgi:hypothetical protein
MSSGSSRLKLVFLPESLLFMLTASYCFGKTRRKPFMEREVGLKHKNIHQAKKNANGPEADWDRNIANIFLHIPKTGGTAFKKMITLLSEKGYETPKLSSHHLTLQEIEWRFPQAKTNFVLRDPIERAVSGYQSRMRMGRPVFNFKWNVAEAVSYSFFQSPLDWLKGIGSDDERLKSASIFAYDNIRHLATNYIYYFGSVQEVRRLKDRFGIIGEISRTNDFVTKVLAEVAPDIEDISSVYEKKHESKVKSSSIVEDLTPEEYERVKTFFKQEYMIYDELRTYINC